MSDVPTWRLYAYMDTDAVGVHDESRHLADWQLQDVLRWCTSRGFDHIYLRRDPAKTTRFETAPPAPVRHRMFPVEERDGYPGDAA